MPTKGSRASYSRSTLGPFPCSTGFYDHHRHQRFVRFPHICGSRCLSLFFFPAYELNSCRGIVISFLHNDMIQKQNNSWRVSGISHLMILFFSGGALSLGGLMSDGSKLGFTWIQYRSVPSCLVMLEKPYMKLGYHITGPSYGCYRTHYMSSGMHIQEPKLHNWIRTAKKSYWSFLAHNHPERQHFFQGSRCFLLPFTQLNQRWYTHKVGPDSKVATLGI